MKRVTYNILKDWINDWNRDHPDVQFVVRAYNDYYHIQDWDTGENIIDAKSPGLAWDMFWIWMKGYWKGVEHSSNSGGTE